MGVNSLIYEFVARGTVVLAEYTTFSGNFSTIAMQCLQKLPANNKKFTYNYDHHTFNFVIEDNFKVKLIVLGIIIAVIFIINLSICKGCKCN